MPPAPRTSRCGRPARQDAAEIARIQVVTWRTAYRRAARAVLDDWDADAADHAWRAAVAAPPTPAHGVLVALERNDHGRASRPSGRPS